YYFIHRSELGANFFDQHINTMGCRFGRTEVLMIYLTNPVQRDLHENCLRNLRLPEWKWRMSSMPFLSMTNRSMPKPQAKPLYLTGSIPASFKTLGWIMPQPPSSIQPV